MKAQNYIPTHHTHIKLLNCLVLKYNLSLYRISLAYKIKLTLQISLVIVRVYVLFTLALIPTLCSSIYYRNHIF